MKKNMCRYEPLKRFLENLQQTFNERLFSFDEIERILDCQLPNSAYEHRAWWSNPTNPMDHPHAQSWLQAGWKVDTVNQQDRWVCFRRTTFISNGIVGQPTDTTGYSCTPPKRVNEQNFSPLQQTTNLQLLLNLGFEEVGIWFIEGDTLQFRLDKNENQRNILYAFVVQGNVKYIGKSRMTLRGRMNGYRNPGPTQTTNKNNNTRIREILQTGVLVKNFALVPDEEVLYKRFPLNVAAGLEDNLLERIRPPWNKCI